MTISGRCRLAPIAIADPAKNLRAKQHAKIAGAEDDTEILWRDVPFLDQTRRRKGDCADVIAVNKGDDGGPDDKLDVERAHSILIEEMRDLNVCRRRHCSSRRKLFYTPGKGMWHAYARWAKGSSSEGEPAVGLEQSRANHACIRLNPYRVPTMKHSYASAGKAPRRRRVHSPSGIAAHSRIRKCKGPC